MSVWFVLALQMFNGTSVRAANVVYLLYALKLGAQPFTIGMLAASFSLFPVMLAVPAGKLSDRFGSRWLLTFGAAGSGIGMLTPYFVPNLPAVFIAGIMSGFSLVFFNVSTQTLVGLLSKPDDRARNFSNFALVNSGTNLLGPLIAGFSIDHVGAVDACLHLALLTLVPIAMLMARGGLLPQGSGHKKRAGGGTLSLLAEPNIRKTLITSSLLLTGMNLYQFYMPVYGHSVGLSASTIGIVLATNSAAAFVVRFFLPRLIARYSEEKMLAYAFFLGAVSLLLIPLLKSAILLTLVSFLFGIGMGAGQPVILMVMFGSSASGRSGEAMGMKTTVNQGTKLIAPIFFGSIAAALGLWPIFVIDALMLGIGGWLSVPKATAVKTAANP
jgi:MFS family permease